MMVKVMMLMMTETFFFGFMVFLTILFIIIIIPRPLLTQTLSRTEFVREIVNLCNFRFSHIFSNMLLALEIVHLSHLAPSLFFGWCFALRAWDYMCPMGLCLFGVSGFLVF